MRYLCAAVDVGILMLVAAVIVIFDWVQGFTGGGLGPFGAVLLWFWFVLWPLVELGTGWTIGRWLGGYVWVTTDGASLLFADDVKRAVAKYWWIAVLPLTPLPLSYAMVVEGLPGLAVMGILGAFVATLWILTDVVCFCIRGEPLHNTLVGVRTSKVQTGRGRGFPVIMREEAGKNGREKAQKRAEAEPHAKPR